MAVPNADGHGTFSPVVSTRPTNKALRVLGAGAAVILACAAVVALVGVSTLGAPRSALVSALPGQSLPKSGSPRTWHEPLLTPANRAPVYYTCHISAKSRPSSAVHPAHVPTRGRADAARTRRGPGADGLQIRFRRLRARTLGWGAASFTDRADSRLRRHGVWALWTPL